MKAEKRSHWFLITCDLETCPMATTVHPALYEELEPVGWFFIKPPKFWRGPDLSFCTQEHRDLFVGNVVRPQLVTG